MIEHSLFYFPYASFTNAQLPLLKVAALYFDKLALLDPVGATWDTIGIDSVADNAVRSLKEAGILEIVTPAAVLTKYEGQIASAIRRDMDDREFMELCDAQIQSSGRQRWTLSLAKVPQEVVTDQAMGHLMGDFAREVARDAGNRREQAGRNPAEYYEYVETGRAYDEILQTDGGNIEYRYADFPLALGESIMMNHAVFAGLLHAGATPITDDPFHSQALTLKLKRAAQEPSIRQAILDRVAQRKIKADGLAAAALMDTDIKLPTLSPEMPLDEVLEYRQRNPEALAQVRDTLGLMARRIQAEPLSADFAREIETQTLPTLIEQLKQAERARDDWLGSERTKQLLKGAGITVAFASAVLAVVTAPVTPVALAAAGFALASGTAIPGAEWLLDWRDGKKGAQENGLHYLLRT